MKAAILEDIQKIIYKEDYPKPIPGPNDALVKVHYCGICGSDVTNFKVKLYQTPLIMGHEFVGEIVELGENITDFKRGDKVLGINVKLDVLRGDFKALGIFQNGGFAEYVKVPKEFLFPIPKATPLQACCLVESYGTAIRAKKLSKIPVNQNIVIIGAGTLGSVTLSVLLSETNPDYIIVIEPYEFLRGKAKELGAIEVFSLNKRRIRKFFEQNGMPSYIFECAGNEKSFKMALDLIGRGKTIVVQGIHRGLMSFPWILLNSKEICIQGILGHDREDILDAIELVEKKKVDPCKLISEVVPLKDIQNAFEKFLEGSDRKFLKILVKI